MGGRCLCVSPGSFPLSAFGYKCESKSVSAHRSTCTSAHAQAEDVHRFSSVGLLRTARFVEYGTDGSLSVPLKDQVPFNSGSAKAADSTAPLNVSRRERAEGGNSTTGLNHLNFSHVCPHADTPSAVDGPQSIFIGRWSSVTLGGPGSATSQVFKR
ncbi:hypothetical protein DPX16_14302 [Anabarilius grahami]|uniref:Uncharacterized protein n=1 Tax=Anabarilius grahami TaxID=495550 RepID=A0A3N0XLS5_ANAGA|nr:hypothetical protein DPX16_14302 [Anabarilius grahami]